MRMNGFPKAVLGIYRQTRLLVPAKVGALLAPGVAASCTMSAYPRGCVRFHTAMSCAVSTAV